MPDPRLVQTLRDIPLGSHAISFSAGPEEARRQAVQFLEGTPPGQAASYWIAEETKRSYYAEELAQEAPSHVGCVAVLDGPQVEWVQDHLRPVAEMLGFVEAHPEGVTAAAETLSQYWGPATAPSVVEYESWFQELPRDRSRFLCPYDLRRVPPQVAEETLRELGAHHTHVALSHSTEPAARLLQLFIFGFSQTIPEPLQESLRWALDTGYVEDMGPPEGLKLTEAGRAVVTEWSEPIDELIDSFPQGG